MNPSIAAHCIAASVLATQSRIRRRMHGTDEEQMAITLELEKIIAALRENGVMKAEPRPKKLKRKRPAKIAD